MKDHYYDESNWLLYLLLAIFGIIIVVNIGVKIWQVTLEIEYDVRYEEAETLSNEYREKYYSMKEAIDSYRIKLEGIINRAEKIVKKNGITIVSEMVLIVLTLVPISLMYMVFRRNKEIAHFYPNRTTSIILNIEVAILLLTCFMNIKGSIEIIEQYQQIFGLVKEMFEGLGTILDTINFQFNQYK